MPGLEFLQCADHEHSEDADAQPCEGGGCCAQESGDYHATRWENWTSFGRPDLVPPVELGMVGTGWCREECSAMLTAAPPPSPPPLESAWSFVLRLALPVRAPSLAS